MTFKTVAIIGAGKMGSGIATNIAQHDVDVRMIDVSEEAVARALETITGVYERSSERGRMSTEEASAAKARLTGSADIKHASDADLVIEAVFERFDLKAELYRRLNPIVRQDTVIATNTSCLTVNGLAQAIDDPGRFLGLHYFNPAAINPIVEVVQGEKTRKDIIDNVIAFCTVTSKKPILCRDGYGFALNRFFVPYSNEAVRVYEEGLGTPANIDRIAENAMGIAAGPFFVMNLVGMQTMAHAAENLTPHGSFYAPTTRVKEMGAENSQWDIGEPGTPDEAGDAGIVDRLWGATFLPILQALDEEIASPADIDMGAGLALRFGKAPCATMDAMGSIEVGRLISYYCDHYGIKMPNSLERVGSLLG
ncbi:MAG: 3-hydroxyadipyl-CoA dehydrogenase [Alphaproteobacteria bacterium MarineAlpha4_Bin2]|nr:MAG: 3-hydroxyadipyl-CoA dehydrogenase [Alphaproteobacteria bacterium MarineAlpha4_Bin2]